MLYNMMTVHVVKRTENSRTNNLITESSHSSAGILLIPAQSRLAQMMFAVFALALASASAYSPAMAINAAAVRAPVVSMSTKYGDPAVKGMKKKNAATGSTLGLKGYTVGSRAPPISKASGTPAQFGYGIDNLYGGGAKRSVAAQKGGKAKAISNANLKGLAPLVTLLMALFIIGAGLKQ